ncbi:murein L,D-transpeptidase catalytic domain family protein [Fusobacterium gonidiaformans]|uniref:murein L,D-transpeptidase catalytic domain family protein n=1 Tax=Fusobacterium gonidiaformans TaxID=849 RepID=UPI0001BC6772|nr:murein L,D-transpeptidase catalytic domain family protein [Fusobacterium gonidiaformans]AVQ16926.1 hypothetical protein C4N16_05025 [Fusobacterium gonidiaformans ATCC 25563]EFS28767.1 hypothetical protein FGAG_01088 [Fusobacterium gonidiaformans ATCC 25563]
MNYKKPLYCLIFILISFSLLAHSFTEEKIESLYKDMNLEKRITFPAFKQGIQGMERIRNRNNNILTIVDFTKPSTEERLYIIDLDKEQVLVSSYVAHGMRTGDLYAKYFSNRKGTLKSSDGFFLTGESYKGKNGFSLRLYGLEHGRNNNAYERTLVIHAARYAEQSFINRYGRLGRSRGCLAVPRSENGKIIEYIQGGSVCYVHSEGLKYEDYAFLNFTVADTHKKPEDVEEIEKLES